MEKKKFAIILHGLGPNGIDTLFKNLSYYWSPDLEVYYILAVDKDNHQFWEDEVSNNGVKIIKIHDLDKGRLKKWPKSLYKALKENGPFEAIHTNMDMLNGINVVVSKYCGINKRVVHAHRSASIQRTNFIQGIISFSYKAIMKILMRNLSTHRLGCSEVAGDYFFGKNNYELMFNCIKYESEKQEIKNCENLDKGDNIMSFCTIGRISEQKNPFKLLEIWKELLIIFPNAYLYWVGDGNLKTKIEQKANKLGISESINFIGTTKEVSVYLKKSQYFLFPSLFEGLSLALAEAQAYNLTCFISDTCSPLSDCGKCVFIPLDKSSLGWAQEISNFIQSGTELNIKEELLDRFKPQKMAQRLEDIYSNG